MVCPSADLGKALGRSSSSHFFNSANTDCRSTARLAQVQQVALLRCLAKHHALKAAYIERLTAVGVPEFKTRIAALKEAVPHQAALRQQLVDVQALVKKMADDGK
jgi:hypothetical protein